MRRLAITGLLLLLAGCSTPTPDAEPSDEPSPAENSAYLDALSEIDPALADDHAVTDGQNICLDIEQGKDDATLARNAGLRFDVDEDTAALIVEAAREHLC